SLRLYHVAGRGRRPARHDLRRDRRLRLPRHRPARRDARPARHHAAPARPGPHPRHLPLRRPRHAPDRCPRRGDRRHPRLTGIVRLSPARYKPPRDIVAGGPLMSRIWWLTLTIALTG